MMTPLLDRKTRWAFAATGLMLTCVSSAASAGSAVPSGPHFVGSRVVFRNGPPASLRQSLHQLEEKQYERAATSADRALREHLTRPEREAMLQTGCVSRIELRDPEAALPYCNAALRIGGKRRGLHLVNLAA